METNRSTWIDKAACAVSDLRKVNAWDSDHAEYRDLAIEICDQCPVRKMCYDDAVSDPDSDGIRASVLFKMRPARTFREDPTYGVPEYRETVKPNQEEV